MVPYFAVTTSLAQSRSINLAKYVAKTTAVSVKFLGATLVL